MLEGIDIDIGEAHIDGDGDQFKGHWRSSLQMGEDMHEEYAVFSAAESDDESVMFPDHVKIMDCVGGAPACFCEGISFALLGIFVHMSGYLGRMAQRLHGLGVSGTAYAQ